MRARLCGSPEKKQDSPSLGWNSLHPWKCVTLHQEYQKYPSVTHWHLRVCQSWFIISFMPLTQWRSVMNLAQLLWNPHNEHQFSGSPSWQWQLLPLTASVKMWSMKVLLLFKNIKRNFSCPASLKKWHTVFINKAGGIKAAKAKEQDGCTGEQRHWNRTSRAFRVLTQSANFAVIYKSSSLWGCNIYTLIKKS